MNPAQDLKTGFDILDGTLDDIEDLPGFSVWPAGAYVVVLATGMERKRIATHPAIAVRFTCVEVKELSNPDDAASAPKAGDTCDTAFMLDNDFGRGFLKLLLKPIGEALKLVKNEEIINGSKGVQLLVVLKKTVDNTKTPPREYCNVVTANVI